MKKLTMFLSVAFITALMFFGCGEPDPDPVPDPNGGGGGVESFTLEDTDIEVEVRQTYILMFDVEPYNAQVAWESSDETVATVSVNGAVRGVKAGTAIITGTASMRGSTGGVVRTCNVTVTAPTSDYWEVVGDTLVHYKPRLATSSGWSGGGSVNADGSYTFNDSSGQYDGGPQYVFPEPEEGEEWTMDDYFVVALEWTRDEAGIDFQVTSKKGPNAGADINTYPTGNQYITIGNITHTFAIPELVGAPGIGYQSRQATKTETTVTLVKATFSKGTVHTITFTGGEYTDMTPIDPIKILDGRTVGYSGAYLMPIRPRRDNFTFSGWYNDTDNANFNSAAAITKDITLSAKWTPGAEEEVDPELNLAFDPDALPPVPTLNPVIPTTYATSSYVDGVLTLTFTQNDQRAVIPLSAAHVMALSESSSVHVVIDGESNPEGSTFRWHLGNASAASAWNATQGAAHDNGPLAGKLDLTLTYTGNKSDATLGYFILQQRVAATTTVTIRSITVTPILQ